MVGNSSAEKALPSVGDGDDQLSIRLRCAHTHAAAVRKLDGIAEQVDHHLLDTRLVGVGLADVVGHVLFQLHAGLDQRADGVTAGGDQFLHIERLGIHIHPTRLDLRQIQQIVDHSQEVIRCTIHLLEVFLLLIGK